jgi:hypothetical protein
MAFIVNAQLLGNSTLLPDKTSAGQSTLKTDNNGIHQNIQTKFQKATTHVNFTLENEKLIRSVLSGTKSPIQKIGSATRELLDSIVTKDASGKNINKTSFYYDSNGNDTLEIAYNWEDENMEWQVSSTTKTVKDNNGMITYYESFMWFGNVFYLGILKYESTYNNLNIQTETSYRWDFFTNNWILDSKTDYFYDSSQNLIRIIYYEMGLSSTDWQETSKTEMEYFANNKLKMETEYLWDNNTSDWINGSKSEHYPNALGNDTVVLSYYWNDNPSGWILSDKLIYTYDGSQRITGITFLELDDDEVELINAFKQEYEFYENGNLKTLSSYMWDSSSGKWEGFHRETITYYASNNLEFIRTSDTWFNDGWQQSSQYESFYNADNNKSLENTYTWNNTSNIWVKQQASTYYYSAGIINENPSHEIQTLSVYPNPASSELHLNGLIQNSRITIVSVDGKTVFSKQHSGKTIDVTSLPDGIYFMQITSKDGKSVHKFIKNHSR